MNCIIGVCVIAAQLTGGGTYNGDEHYKVLLQNGSTQDVSSFYAANNIPFTLEGEIRLSNHSKISLGFDTGIKAKKQAINPSFAFGFKKIEKIAPNMYLTFGFKKSWIGDIENIPCQAIGATVNRLCKDGSFFDGRYVQERKGDTTLMFGLNIAFN